MDPQQRWTERRGVRLLGMLLALTVTWSQALADPAIDPLFVSGTVEFENTHHVLFEDEDCSGGVWGPGPGTGYSEEELITHVRTFGQLGACSANDVVVQDVSCVPSSTAVPYCMPLCEEAGQFELRAHVYFDDEEGDGDCDGDFGNPGFYGDDVYIFAPVLSDDVDPGNHAPCPTGPCDDDDTPCLPDQPITSCAGALVIEYTLQECDGDLITLCPDESFYPISGLVLVHPSAGSPIFQARTLVKPGRQTRFAVPACSSNAIDAVPGSCDEAVPAAADEPCTIELDCPLDDPDCDFAAVAPSCLDAGGALADGFTYAEVPVVVELPGLELVGRLLKNVPIICGAETRISVELPAGCGTTDRPDLAGRFEVVAYQDEIIYSTTPDAGPFFPYDEPGTPHVQLDNGPSGNRRETVVTGDYITACPTIDYKDWLIEDIPPSSLTSLDSDKGYDIWSSFALDSDKDLDVWVVSTPHSKGLNAASDEEKNSTAWALYSACATLFDPDATYPLDQIAFLPDEEGDWLHFIDDDATYLFKRCLDLATDACSDVALPTNSHPDCADLSRDPFIMTPGELQGCLVLDDDGLAVAETLVFDFSDFPFGDDANRFEGFRSNSRAETLGAILNLETPIPCESTTYPDGACADETADWRHGDVRERAQVWSRLVEASSDNDASQTNRVGACDPDDGRAYRYRVVPGTFGNLDNSYQTNRFRLNFHRDGECPIDGIVRINRDPRIGNGNLRQIPGQTTPGTQAPLDEDLNIPMGRLDVFMISRDLPFNTERNPFILDPQHDLLYPPILAGQTDPDSANCTSAHAVFTDVFPDDDTGFNGVVEDDNPFLATVHAPLPAGTYDLNPTVVFENFTARTTFPVFAENVVIEKGMVTRLCLDTDPRPTSALAENGVFYPDEDEGTPNPPFPTDCNDVFACDLFNEDSPPGEDCCLRAVDITVKLFDCEQETDPSQFEVNITGGLPSPGRAPGFEWCETEWYPVTAANTCGPGFYTFHLWIEVECEPDPDTDPTTTFRIDVRRAEPEIDPDTGEEVYIHADPVLEVGTQAIDVEPPVFDSLPEDETFECGEDPPAPPMLTATDCNNATVLGPSVLVDTDSCGLETITRTWTAIDDCGNSSTAVQIVTEQDTTKPVLSADQSIEIECGDSTEPQYTVEDCTPVTVDAQPVQVPKPGDCPQIWKWKIGAVDCVGNEASPIYQTVILNDEDPPIIADEDQDGIEIYELPCGDPLPDPPGFLDLCDPHAKLMKIDEQRVEQCPDTYTQTRTWLARDSCGNTAMLLEIFHTVDEEAPVITAPGDVGAFSCAEIPGPGATVEDNCDPDPSLELDEKSTCADSQLVITRTWTATDRCGNSSTASHDIFVPIGPPVMDPPPADELLACDAADPVVNDPPLLSAVSDCPEHVGVGVIETISGPTAADCTDDGYQAEWIRTWTATDTCGNSVTAQQVIRRACCTCPSWDFEGYAAGTQITTEFTGITFEGNGGSGQIRVFDTANPTCDDDDLATPGDGDGNDEARDHILILHEGGDCIADDNDGPGSITATFDEPTAVSWVGLLDSDEPGAEIFATRVGGLTCVFDIPAGEDNNWQAVDIGLPDVIELRFELVGSIGLTDIVCDPSNYPEQAPGTCP